MSVVFCHPELDAPTDVIEFGGPSRGVVSLGLAVADWACRAGD